MTRNQHHHTKIKDHECIAHSREGMRSAKFLPPGPDCTAKPFDGNTHASASAPVSAATDQRRAQIDL